MIILNIRSGLSDVFHTWTDFADFSEQHGIPIIYIWERGHRRCGEFQRYFSGLEYLDLHNIELTREDNLDLKVDVVFDSWASGDWKPLSGSIEKFCTLENAKQNTILIRTAMKGAFFDSTKRTGNLLKKIKPSEYI